MRKNFRKLLAVVLTVSMLLSSFAIGASAWSAAPSGEVDLSLNLVGLMNVKIFQDSPYIANVSTTTTGTLSGQTLYAYKFSGTGTSIGKNWPHQMGDGPYTEAQFQSYFGVDAINECMEANEEEVAVYMLYDFGDPQNTDVRNKIKSLGLDPDNEADLDEFYNIMANEAKINISAYAGGGTAHETAITAYYRYSSDWRDFAKNNSGKYIPRDTMISMGIAAPNENRYFFETQESQKRLDGGDAFPGVFDPSVQQYIDHNETYSLPVWEDTDEDASWNIVNPVPTCNIYSRWGTEYSKDTSYEEIKAIKDAVIIDKYGEDYTDGEWYGYTDDQVRYYDGLDIDDMIVPKNWEWESIPYYSTKSGSTYSATTASKSHLGYGEYCPAAIETWHEFYLPENHIESSSPSRFMTVMVRETGTMCGLDGCGHWHSVKVSAESTVNKVRFQPRLTDDSAVIDYGLKTTFAIDEGDFVWTTGTTTASAPAIDHVALTAGNPTDESGYGTVAYGKYGVLEITKCDKTFGDDKCMVTYTPTVIVDDVDTFYYKVYPSDTKYEPMYAKITVVPASVVYYEDNFSANDSSDVANPSLIYDGTCTVVDSGGNETGPIDIIDAQYSNDATQQSENENYGYDLYYDGDFGYSSGTAHKAQKNDRLTFTFKGTGCDIIMRTDAEDGNIRYSVTKSAVNDDGSKADGATEVTPTRSVNCRNDNDSTLYQLPVVSVRYGELAYYTVTLWNATSRDVYIDGVRVYNPLGFSNEIGPGMFAMEEFYNKLEKNAETGAVYDMIYNSKDIANGEIGFIGIFDNWNEWYGTEKNEDGEATDFNSHLEIGPNNEVYLAPGQSLVFNVTNATLKNTLFAIEAKGVTGGGKMTVSAVDSNKAAQVINVNSNTAMYYKYDLEKSGIKESGQIKIQNSGDTVLALSNLKYSRILVTSGKVAYKFVDETGAPVTGTYVVVRDSKGETVAEGFVDETGTFICKDLPVGAYKAYITTPKGKSSVAARTVTVSEESSGDVAQFTLRDIDLEIGSAPEIWHSATANIDYDRLTFNDFYTFTEPGSFMVTYTFDGSNSGKVSDKYYLNGILSVIVNSDGTASYNFVGSGKADKKTIKSVSGTTTDVDFSRNELSIHYHDILNDIFGASVVSGIDKIMPEGTPVYIQAFELPDASDAGEYGEPKEIIIGDEAYITSLEKATVSYSFTFNDEPVQGVTVTIDGKSATTGADGTVTITDVSLGRQVAKFTTPGGYSNVRDIAYNFTPAYKEDSKSFELIDFDLTIGSAPHIWHTPSADVTSSKQVTLKDIDTFTDAGSYKIDYTFDSSNATIDGNNFLGGTLSIIANEDGTATWTYTGDGKAGGKACNGKTGTISFSTNSNGDVTINYNTIIKALGFSDQNAAKIKMPDGTDFTVTAYENTNAGGQAGDPKTITIGEKPTVTSSQTATLVYNFIYGPTGEPLGGVEVEVDGQTAVSGADGNVTITDVTIGDQTVKFTTPNGRSYISDEHHSFTPDNYTYSHTYTLYDFDLTIGSSLIVWHTPSASETKSTISFTDLATYTPTGSFKFDYTFDGSSTGYINKDNKIKGLLTVTVNADGTASWTFTKDGGNFSSKSGTLSSSNVSIDSDKNNVSINYSTIINSITGGVVTDITGVMPDRTKIAVTAYENSNLAGHAGKTEYITIGVPGMVTSNEAATVNYTFTFNGDPVEGVKVTVDGKTATSGADGKVTITDISLAEQTVTFSTPKGLSDVKPETHSFTPTYTEYSKDYALRDFDLELGSHPSIWHTPSALFTMDDQVIFKDIKTYTDAGSYTFEYTFDGSSSGYVNGNNYLAGTLTVTVNSDGTATYSYSGGGKANNKSLGAKSGNATASINSNGDVTVDILGIVSALGVQGANDIIALTSDESYFMATAYENANGGGEAGPSKALELNQPGKVLSNQTADVHYTFTSNGAPLAGVRVSVGGKSATSGADGKVDITDITIGDQKVTFTTPKGKSNIATENHSFTPTDYSYTKTYDLIDYDLTIGSAPSIWHTPSVERASEYDVIFKDIATFTPAGSYKFTINFDGTKDGSGYVSGNNYANGVLTVIVNSDGTATYSYSGGGKKSKDTNIGKKSGTTTASINSNGDVTVDLLSITQALGLTAKDVATILPNGTVFNATAYENANATAPAGESEQLILGQAGQITSDQKADLHYTFTYEGAPFAGVQVTVNGKTATSGADGKVDFTGIDLGEQTVTFATPAGKSNIKAETHSFTPTDYTYSHEYEITDFDLTIGSDPDNWKTPNVQVKPSKVIFDSVKPLTDPETYIITFDFHNPVNGGHNYIDFDAEGNSYLEGPLIIYANADGTSTCSYEAIDYLGRINEQKFDSKSGVILDSDAVKFTDNGVEIDYVSVFNSLAGTSGYNVDLTYIWKSGEKFTIQAKDVANQSGNTATLTVGATPTILSDQTADLHYTFTYNDEPVSGVKVTVDGKTATSGADGTVDITGVSLGEQTVTFVTPNGKSNIANENHSFTPDDYTYSHDYELTDFDLTIGSHPSLWRTPSVEITDGNKRREAIFKDIAPATDPGSYKFVYTFDPNTSGKLNSTDYLDGTLTVIVNADGTAAYSYDGTGKCNGSTLKSRASSATASFNSNGDVTIDYRSILYGITDSPDLGEIPNVMADGTSFTVTAYENANASGQSGPSAVITIGQDGQITSDQKADLHYTFTFEDAPLAGVKVTVDGKTATSGADGKVDITGVSLGDQTVTFTTPSGLSKIKVESHSFTPSDYSYTHEYELIDFDLTLGSAPSVWHSPTVDYASDHDVIFKDIATSTPAGSYKFVYSFDGTNGGSGYLNKDNYLNGTLTVTVNADGTTNYSYSGGGKKAGNNVGAKTGTTTGSINSNGDVTVDILSVIKALGLNATDVANMVPSGTAFTATAYEDADATGTAGDSEQLVLGQAGQITSDQKADLHYTFTYEGAPFAGVQVTVNGKTFTSGADGKVDFTGIDLGEQTVTITTPAGKSNIKAENHSFTPTDYTYSHEYEITDFDLTIGSDPSNWKTPNVQVKPSKVIFDSVKPLTDPATYVITFDFSKPANSSDDFIDFDANGSSFLEGPLTIYANADGTSTCSYATVGYNWARINGVQFADKSNVQLPANAVTFTDNGVEIDYIAVFNALAGTTNYNVDLTYIWKNGEKFTIQAKDIANQSGNTATLTVGATPTILSDQTADLHYTFTYNDEPVSGVKVTVDGKTATSGADGTVDITGVSLGEQTVTFTTPSGKSDISPEQHNFTPTDYTYSHDYTLVNFDLTIGSGSTDGYYATASTNNVDFVNVRPSTTPGSYLITYHFDGTSGGSGYVNGNKYIRGDLTIIVNADGTATFNFDGSGRVAAQGWATFGSESGSTNAATITSDGVSINFVTLLGEIAGYTGYFTDASAVVPNGSSFTIKAYESPNNADRTGDSATVTVGSGLSTDEFESEEITIGEVGSRYTSPAITADSDEITIKTANASAAAAEETPVQNTALLSGLTDFFVRLVKAVFAMITDIFALRR